MSTITDDLKDFIAERDSFYLATASKDGQPYIQHRGGPPGFLRVTGDSTLAFADLAGNRQYMTVGNLAENDRAFIFLMNYERKERIKIWGRARVVTDLAFAKSLLVPGQKGRVERAIVFEVDRWDANCPAFIPQKLDAEPVKELVDGLRARIAELEKELARHPSRS